MPGRALIAALCLVFTACTQVTVETTTLSDRALPPADAATTGLAAEEAAAGICEANAWAGMPEPATFAGPASELDVDEEALAAAVRRRCPDLFYEPLSRAEIDWCGDGVSFGQNFFRVVQAGVDLGIQSFAVVDPGLISKAAGRTAELSDYDIELLTAGLQTMAESSRFERDWAEACRSTF
jgi:hypothetical protein